MLTGSKRFIKETNSVITFNSKDKKTFLKLLEKEILGYENIHTSCTYETLVIEFGSPIEVAASYIEALDTGEILKQLNQKKLVKIIISIIIFAILATWSFKMYRLNQLYEIAKNDIQLCEQTTITEEGE